LECVTNEAHSLDGRHSFQLAQERIVVDSGEYDGGTPFTDFLNSMASRGTNEYVLFLVRPEGLESFTLLRDIIQKRNKSVSRCSSRRILEQPEPIPDDLAAKGAEYSNARLYFTGRMASQELDILKNLFSDPASRALVDELYQKTQSLAARVDYVTELLPSRWQVRAAMGVRAADNRAARRRGGQ